MSGRRRSRAPTWSSSLPARVAAPGPVLRRSSPISPGRSGHSPSGASHGRSRSRGAAAQRPPRRGPRRAGIAQEGIGELQDGVDTVIVIENDRLLQVIDKDPSVVDAFRLADDVLRQGVQGITDLITIPGLINLDFADVRTIMREAGSALMGIGIAHGDKRATEAAQKAVSSPLLDSSIDGATGVLLNVTGPPDMGLFEVTGAAEFVTAAAAADANIIFGAVIDEAMGDDLRVTVIATGFGEQHRRRRRATPTGEPRSQREPVATTAVTPREQKPSESFDIPDEVLDVPSFLRDS